jgi:short-subunit dehydrogenase involved in D-alanine esterification of teichoic acids
LVDVGGKKDTKAFDDSRLTTIDIDVREEDSIREASEKVKEKFGSDCLRLLFNVSGIVSSYDLEMCDVYSYR